ncbi:MAG: hypothetical protein ACK58T_45295, partial [Phycisphaerae bacterium]
MTGIVHMDVRKPPTPHARGWGLAAGNAPAVVGVPAVRAQRASPLYEPAYEPRYAPEPSLQNPVAPAGPEGVALAASDARSKADCT